MLRIIGIKECMRCGGDLFWERDEYGVYISCIQCGAAYDVVDAALGTRRFSQNTGSLEYHQAPPITHEKGEKDRLKTGVV